jgi:hypothetical protein
MPVAEMQGKFRRERHSHWHGRSGRDYELVGEPIDSFAMSGALLYVLAKGSHILWVGSADDLVTDPASRSRFRLAMNCADRAFRLSGDGPDADRFATIWDLEGASPASAVQAA